MPASEAVMGLGPEQRREYDQLTPDQQEALAGYTTDQLSKVLTDRAVAAAMASTVQLTPEEQAMSPEEFGRHIMAEQDRILNERAARRQADREAALQRPEEA